ncbi:MULTISPECIES: rhomboid-like protein [Streptomycetaceae]|uniref:Uncharacterized protein n=1 Tax=Streptantibioticus cattleyicolor (strain ATCC 35852 / DSM 46488 / JCM 4925 / NBRC 14057 / NRRL 8057) TaxID=1003195 RepID=F8JY96_STREN|nr:MULTISPECIES: rhomboid-like protein [Streptomycetaceae]AEW94688.1 hypothetical protein SCATT_23170 [Streptantibioticus cattleyicolor NRRL 8057 = DSM 46488]MYS59320.1 hypothetical protein [Streptomyces sp. SID5468]CCB75042.1 conserved membrane protein of unknown function [Streptantibioticus cattleyicolor NRRL 8057 = DSM 46488]
MTGSILRRAPGAAWRYLRAAPGTFVWLAVLLATTRLVHHFPPGFRDRFLEHRSTNVHNLWRTPVRVLVASALYLDGGGWPLYFVLYNLFHVPVERWLGTWRWLGVAAVAHVGATYLSEGLVLLAVRTGYAPHSALFTRDIGVSYALAGVQGALTHRLPRPWRYGYLACLLGVYGFALAADRTFTGVGHLTAALLGLACVPAARWSARRYGTRRPRSDDRTAAG